MEKSPISILIADDHQMFIDGIKSLLKKETQFLFVGEVNSGSEAIDFLSDQAVDVLITDISMPGMDGVALTKEVKRRWPEVKVLVLSMHNDSQIVGEIMLAEAEGYILKNTGRKELVEALAAIADGGTHYSREVMTLMMQRIKREQTAQAEVRELTDRELEILRLVVQEYSTAEIAERLFISPRTVDTHRKNILVKTQSRTIVGLIKFAFRNGLIA